VPPSVVWGVGVGLVIAAIDTLSLVLMGMDGTSEWPIPDADFLANVILYSYIGFRVGKVTGVVREAAEAGVIAGVLVAAVAIAATYVLRPAVGGMDSTNALIGIVAQNVAIGGVLAILAGWIGARAQPDRPASRR
jgi:predicted anti-sigma-YlaC factor YlaD